MKKDNKRKLIVCIAGIFIAAVVLFSIIFYEKTPRKPVDIVKYVLDSREKITDQAEYEQNIKPYFTNEFFSKKMQSDQKLPVPSYELTPNTDNVILSFNVADENGSRSQKVAEFIFEKSSTSLLARWKISNILEIDPLYSKSLGNILPVHSEKTIKFGEPISPSENLEIKVKKIVLAKSNLSLDEVSEDSYQLTFSALENSLPISELVYFDLEDDNGQVCSEISSAQFDPGETQVDALAKGIKSDCRASRFRMISQSGNDIVMGME
ncbi:hypothetical protein COT77_00770 [Candidatus Berkelbacteria bacterium CG10_big_fil_rev_8_21_14_0_10_41_12]|uniref:Uncharacterized protein n=1 Tax=Candidatus Berkelbacteria bacterium CG10_big_fil_rev_8_21_14_0_10_41_12 TaxID=1974513 RepID=A0A2M6WXN6_9BACT|nr:MAG: hypothetical protein COT77_00770 [Candidatus Berkelbacteria bacterium CG10_big_fil_rev_8_21_14_0_10_41_12]